MKTTSKTKFISDVNMEEKNITSRRPFPVKKENQRRYVRLEISSPMDLRKIKDIFGNFWPNDDGDKVHGSILNISAGGVLAELDQPINEGDIVSMKFSLQEIETVDHVLGLVKRTDITDDIPLAGIEFIGKDYLIDKLSQSELEMIPEDYSNFATKIKNVLDKYIRYTGIAENTNAKK